MGTVAAAVFVSVLLMVVAFDVLGDPLSQGIGLRVLRRVSAGRWPPEEATWQHRIAGAVLGWLLILGFLAAFYLMMKLLA